MSTTELLAIARQYEVAREELRRVFQAMPEAEQQAAKEIVRQLRAQDQARIRAALEEEERELAARK